MVSTVSSILAPPETVPLRLKQGVDTMVGVDTMKTAVIVTMKAVRTIGMPGRAGVSEVAAMEEIAAGIDAAGAGGGEPAVEDFLRQVTLAIERI